MPTQTLDPTPRELLRGRYIATLGTTNEYREEMDIFGRFERDCLTFANPTAEAFGRSMYSTYTTWCKQNGHYAVNIRKFLAEYRKRHGNLSESHNKMYGATFSGVGILIDGHYLDPEDVS